MVDGIVRVGLRGDSLSVYTDFFGSHKHSKTSETLIDYEPILAHVYFIILLIISIINGVAAFPTTPSNMLLTVFKDSVRMIFFGFGDLI